ncbi:B- and T-lymphocyte attenuator isoform X2 [Struthio camelus]|uniref:B- and T-lymphocyte attenuator isoform X2 n=1 Tax=Struthio camelus TaxID=8801 RepID=UPI00051E4FAD|nr:PREDICTED: B- and T-lymphocyte attenuator isoform X2 [Struthio camelus australis]
MKGPPVMFIKRILLHILLVMLAQSNYQVYGFDATDCPVEIQVKRNSQYKSYLGNSLVIYCPVHYCQERPAVQWCKIEGNECMLLKESKAEWKANNKFILEFFSVHHNDSGTYRCRATAGTLSSESHGIRVIVEEKPANIITSSSETKQKRTPLTPQRRETLVRGPAAIPYCAAGTTQASDESSSLYYCSMVSPWQLSDSSAIYDNDVPHCDAHRTAPKAPHCDPAIPSISAAPESQDVLIYAALNHSASAEKCQRREPRVENELTEYASITVKNKPSQDFSSHPLCRQSQV